MSELEDFTASMKVLVGKAVHRLAADTIAGRGERAEHVAKKIIQAAPAECSGYVSLSFEEFDFTLNVSLSIVDKDYRTDISIPSDKYVRDLLNQYDFLKNAALAYWKVFCIEQPRLCEKLRKIRPDVDFSALVIDPHNPTVMYFDPALATRIGIFCYYTDANGQPYYKK